MLRRIDSLLRSSWRLLFRRKEIDQDLDDEVRFAVALLADEKMKEGIPPDEARRLARIELGGIEQVKERVRSGRAAAWLDSFLQDIRFAFRMLRKSLGFTTVAIITLALGIGANTAIFTLIYEVMLKQVPVANPHELYRIGEGEYYCCEWGGLEGSWGTFDYPYYKHVRDTNPAFEQLAAFSGGVASFSVRRADSNGQAQTTDGEYVSGNYFSTLGIQPSLGRLISPSDDEAKSPATAVMGYSAWRGRYGADPSIVGSTILVNGLPVTLVGVAPPGFVGDRLTTDPPELWIPLNQEPIFEGEGQASILNSSGAWLYVVGRLKAGVLPAKLQTQMSLDLQNWLRSNRELSKDDLAELPKQHIQIMAGGAGISSLRSNSETGLYLLAGASLLVLWIACANLANLLFARSAARQPQTALRLALGASRLRLIRAALVESVLLSVIGGAAGVSVAYAGTKAIVLIVFRGATDIPVHATPSLPVLGFAFLLSLLTGVIFGIAPAWIGTRASLSVGLRGSRIAPHASSNAQKVLVVVQAALSIVLLTVAGLVTQSLLNLEKTDLGFQTQGRLLADINFKAAGYKPEQLLALYERLQRRLEQIPGVKSTSLSRNSPLDLCCINLNISIGGRTDKWIEDVNVVYNRVSPHYFETIGTPLVRGRAINDQDTEATPHVAVVDEAFAHRFFPNQDAIGKTFGLSVPGHEYDYLIVGIAKDAKYKKPEVTASPTMFLPFAQTTQYGFAGYQRLETSTLYAQSIQLSLVGPPEQYEKAFLDALASIDPNLSVVRLTSYSEQVAIQFNRERLIARLTGLFSLLAVALASVGLYGVTGYSVVHRTSEIGTRMALGAGRGNIVVMVVRSALLQVVIGLSIGLPVATLIARYLAHELYEIGRFDPLVLGGATVFLCACALVAGLLPARRASSIDPMVALRHE